jgi:hypothetical protein
MEAVHRSVYCFVMSLLLLHTTPETRGVQI